MLAAVEYEMSMYRSVTRHRRIIREGIEGNPDAVPDADLARRARGPVASLARQRILESLGRLRQADEERRTACEAEILAAAEAGQVHTLFLSDSGAGRSPDGPEHAPRDETRALPDDDLVDRALHLALDTGSKVIPVPPTELSSPMEALLRSPKPRRTQLDQAARHR